MADKPDSHRPQDRDFTVDKWEQFPFPGKDNPFENRSEERKDDAEQSQYEYEGWEHNAFPNKDVSEEPAEPADLDHKVTKNRAKQPRGKQP